MTPAQLSEAVLRSVRHAVDSGELRAVVPATAGLRRPPHGDAHWSTGIALRLAGPAGRPAPEVAALVRRRLSSVPGVASVAVSGPGFLNITLDAKASVAVVSALLATARPHAVAEDPARDVDRWRQAAGGDPAELLVQRDGNPLFRVRYAHARTRALARAGRAFGTSAQPLAAEFGRPGARALIGLLAEWPRVSAGPPAGVARHLVGVADALAELEREGSALPRGDEKPGAVHRARLALAQAAGTVLADGLSQLGINAPDHL